MSKKPWAKMATEREAVLCVDVPVVVAIRVVGSSGDTHTHCNRHLHFQGTKYSRGRRSALARATRIDSRLAGLWPRSALARANRIDSRLAGLWPRSVFANATRIDSRFAGLWPSPTLKSCSSRKSYCWGSPSPQEQGCLHQPEHVHRGTARHTKQPAGTSSPLCPTTPHALCSRPLCAVFEFRNRDL